MLYYETFEDTYWVTKSRRRTDNVMTKMNKTTIQTMIYKTVHRQLKIE
jgi:hypothetical protein